MNRAYLLIVVMALAGCRSVSQQRLTARDSTRPSANESPIAAKNSVPVIHVFVALCDNVNQGIVPVAPSLGNGDDPARNLYWGAAFGLRTFFGKNKDWQAANAASGSTKSSSVVLDRVVLKHRKTGAFLVAEAYRGKYIRNAIEDFLAAAAGAPGETLNITENGKSTELHLGGSANLIAYVGHDGLMDFQLTSFPKKHNDEKRDAIILACASKSYFSNALRATGANPLLWTTNLMAPEAYILSAAVDGWLSRESDEQVRLRAAQAYNQYQHCGVQSANALFATGW